MGHIMLVLAEMPTARCNKVANSWLPTANLLESKVATAKDSGRLVFRLESCALGVVLTCDVVLLVVVEASIRVNAVGAETCKLPKIRGANLYLNSRAPSN